MNLSTKFERAGKVWNVIKQLWLVYMLLGGVITMIGNTVNRANLVTDLGQVIQSFGLICLFMTDPHFLDNLKLPWIYYHPLWAKGNVLTKRGFLFLFALVALLALIGFWAFRTGSRIYWSEYIITAYAVFGAILSLVRICKKIYRATTWYREWAQVQIR